MEHNKNRIVCIDSRDKSGSGTYDDFRVSLEEPMVMPKKISLLEASIPADMHVFSSHNSTIDVTEQTGSLNFQVTITEGSYSTSTLETELKTILDAGSAASGNTLTYTVTYNSSVNTFTIAATGNFSIDFTVDNAPFRELGFTSVALAQAASHESTESINISIPKRIFLEVDLPLTKIVSSKNNQINSTSSQTGTWVIPLTGTSFSIENFTQNSYYKLSLTNFSGTISQIKTRLLVYNHRLAGIRSDWAYTLLFEY